MWTILLAVLAALILGRAYEGTVQIGGLLACCNMARWGRIGIATWAYRPGRVYVRVNVDTGRQIAAWAM